MKVRLTRNLYHHTPETGLTSKTVFKDYDWEIPPVVGATIEDSAWHRNDITKIDEIHVTAEEGDMYFVTLNPRRLDESSHINKLVEVVNAHGWKVLY